VHNLRLEADINIEATKYLQHSLGDEMLTPEDDEDVWGDDCSSNEESDNDYCSDDNEDDDDDIVVGAFYQVSNEMIWVGMIPWASLAQNAEPIWSFVQ
jgi:hypothetical protein